MSRKLLTPPETGATLHMEPRRGFPPPQVRPYHISQALRGHPDTEPDLLIDLYTLLTHPNALLTQAEQTFLLRWSAGWSKRAAHQVAGLSGNPSRNFRKLLQRLADWFNRDA